MLRSTEIAQITIKSDLNIYKIAVGWSDKTNRLYFSPKSMTMYGDLNTQTQIHWIHNTVDLQELTFMGLTFGK